MDKIIESIKDVKPLIGELVNKVSADPKVWAMVSITIDRIDISIYHEEGDETDD